ncbi:homoserine dehydrogenase [Halobacillus amylolyticus]|uniref:Homoserine dehydrogenase n=1 Tax=Halobacillus amylolyticus TaxID=2932259 RepID=A0ABY4H9I3_9BACI|nr:homoserine dehydrogenase [Halobacillus amylolyticus]UOR11098.1 homoserine dehydrogenase [Halobacillus amylolyticus]
MTIKVAILGFGTVGQGVYQILQNKQKQLTQLTGESVQLCGVLVQNKAKERILPDSVLITDQFDAILAQEPDVIFEAIVGEQPSFSYLTKAIDKRIHVITANKVMFAKHGTHLLDKAANHVGIGYEATTASGTPIISMITKLLQVNSVTKIEAILNGTSNFILSSMQNEGKSLNTALTEAQAQGFAEADPTNDIEGYDAFYKLMILSQLIYKRQPNWADVPCEGITNVTTEDLTSAKTSGQKIRHIAAIEEKNGELYASIKPQALPPTHGLHSVDGVDNAIHLISDLAGPLTLRGPGAGKLSTASAMVEDFVHILQSYPVKLLQY